MSSPFQFRKNPDVGPQRQRGFSFVEIAMVILVALIMLGCAVPIIDSTLIFFRVHGAASSAVWAIQSARYQALMQGYPFQVTFNSTNNSYQLASKPIGAGSFANVGSAVPLSGDAIKLNQTTTLQLSPNGSVTATAGTLSFTITYQGSTETITVTNYGNVTVTP